MLHVVFSQNTWTSVASFGGGERERAVSFVIGERAYVGTGIDTANICKKDLWEYDPGSNSWTQKADVPGTARRDAIGFGIGNRGYVGTGINGVFAWIGSKKDDFYEYNPSIILLPIHQRPTHDSIYLMSFRVSTNNRCLMKYDDLIQLASSYTPNNKNGAGHWPINNAV